MRHKLSLLLLCISLLCISSCSRSDDMTGPSVNIENLNINDAFVSFDIPGRQCAEIAYTVLPSDSPQPTAGQLFSDGTVVLPGYCGCAHSLEAESSYVIYAAARSADGALSAVTSKSFTTAASRHFKMNISYINYSTVAFKNIVPDDLNKKYVMYAWDDEGIEWMLKEYNLDSIEDIPEYLYANNMIDDYFVNKGIMSQNEGDISFWVNCSSDTQMYFYIWYVNDDKSPASEMECTTVKTTPVPDRSPLYLDLEQFEVQQAGTKLTFRSNIDFGGPVPLMYFEYWTGLAYYKASMFEEGMTDLEIARSLLDKYPLLGMNCGIENGYSTLFEYRNGSWSNCVPDYEPGAEYLIIFFGCYEGKVTTDPVVRRFTMPDDGKGEIIYDAPAAGSVRNGRIPAGIVNKEIRAEAR